MITSWANFLERIFLITGSGIVPFLAKSNMSKILAMIVSLFLVQSKISRKRYLGKESFSTIGEGCDKTRKGTGSTFDVNFLTILNLQRDIVPPALSLLEKAHLFDRSVSLVGKYKSKKSNKIQSVLSL